MAKYRKKPVIIEAFKVGRDEEPAWLMTSGTKVTRFIVPFHESRPDDYGYPSYEIDTLEGTMKASYGDYIIKGVNGEIYPCKPDIFVKTYELVDETGVL